MGLVNTVTLCSNGEITGLSEDGTATKVIATFSQSPKEVAATLQLCGCTLSQLQELVRRFTFRTKSVARDNKPARKLITFAAQSGSAPVFRTTLAVDILPAIVDVPAAFTNSPLVIYRGEPVELFTACSAPMVHFAKGATIRATIDLPPEDVEASPYSIDIGKKLNVSYKEDRDKTSVPLLVDNKRVGTISIAPTKTSIDMRVTTENSALTVQKVVRSVVFSAIAAKPVTRPVGVMLVVSDDARAVSWSLTVFVAPPDVPRTASVVDLLAASLRGGSTSSSS